MVDEMYREILNTAAGLATLNEWLGEGGRPITHEVAETRALICARCPMNQKGHWWNIIKSGVAEAIRRHIAVKDCLEVETIHDPELGTCRICSCNLPLKIHVPIHYVKKNMPEGQLQQFPAHCWIVREIKNL